MFERAYPQIEIVQLRKNLKAMRHALLSQAMNILDAAKSCAAEHSPSSAEEGWPRHQENIAKRPLMEQTGWCWSGTLANTTPSARKGSFAAFSYFAQPPLLG
jgi:hypothetical protein